MANHYLGVDIGSSFTKFTVIDSNNVIQYQKIIKTLTQNKQEQTDIIENIFTRYKINYTCATGCGRQYFKYSDITKTEIHCASVGVSALYPEEKTIIDIGGEDIKVIKSGADGKILDFSMNDKCAAGTGTFITEIAERADIKLSKMSELAAKSHFKKELNSFCTVFAKTEIMKWVFDEVPVEDLAKGIYISIINRIAKFRMDKTLPVYLIGGVVKYHPHLRDVMEKIFNQHSQATTKIKIIENPQFTVSYSAALLAKKMT
ncbi:MAG: acyl-CoA dehydratase activase [Bacteroidota bacterium]